MSKDDEIISLFEGDPNNQELIQIWQGSITKEIHLMFNGYVMINLSPEGLTELKEAVTIAEQKINDK